jgi:hypothetical protein
LIGWRKLKEDLGYYELVIDASMKGIQQKRAIYVE